jgi:hypothetical protein
MGRPNKRLQILGVVAVLGLVVAVCLLVPGSGEDEKPKLTGKPPAEAAGKGATPNGAGGPQAMKLDIPVEIKDGIGRLGRDDSPVKIEVFYPGHSGCGSETADFAYRVYQANKDKLRLVLVNFETPTGAKYQGDAGLHCSGIAINGKQEYEVSGKNDEGETVQLASNLGDRWTEDQFLKALDVAFEKAYGKPANHKLPPPKKPGAGNAGKATPRSAPLKGPPLPPPATDAPPIKGGKV